MLRKKEERIIIILIIKIRIRVAPCKAQSPRERIILLLRIKIRIAPTCGVIILLAKQERFAGQDLYSNRNKYKRRSNPKGKGPRVIK